MSQYERKNISEAKRLEEKQNNYSHMSQSELRETLKQRTTKVQRRQMNFDLNAKLPVLRQKLMEIDRLTVRQQGVIAYPKQQRKEREYDRLRREFKGELVKGRPILEQLKELKQMTKNLEKNKFEPRIPDIGNSFGTLTLKTYTSDHLLTSQILSQSQCMELMNLCEFSHGVKWTLLYRGSRDGFGAHNFHAKCDGKSQTLTLLKAKDSKFIFGGFTATDWDSFSKWKNDPHAFLFSLTKREKIQVIPEKSKFAIWCSPSCGPIFGAGRDLAILNNSNLTSCNYSDLGHTYKSLKYEMNLSDSREFFADSRNFKLAEIEVYQKE
jgi:hypothetical protein